MDQAQASGDKRIGGIKHRDRSIALLLVGFVLLFPPVAGLSLIDTTVFGIPFPVFYVFAVWAALIAGAALLARPLLESDNATTPTDYLKPDS